MNIRSIRLSREWNKRTRQGWRRSRSKQVPVKLVASRFGVVVASLKFWVNVS